MVGAGAPDGVQLAGAEGLHGLQARLDDQRRLELGRGGQHGLEREVVDDVDRRDAVTLGERVVEDLTHLHHGHRTDAPPDWFWATLTRICTEFKE